MKIVIASNNAAKSKEIQAIFGQEGFESVLQSEFNIGSVEETGLTFAENAILKARHAAKHTNMSAVADDSGIIVDALLDEPGIYSARYAGENATDEENNEKLLARVRDLPESKWDARFVCVIVFLRTPTDPLPIICEGVWKGKINPESFGENGFGYDPIFFLPERNCTSAQLPPELKNKISHRGQALQKLKNQLYL